jgi:hypothetical protein
MHSAEIDPVEPSAVPIIYAKMVRFGKAEVLSRTSVRD